MAAYTHRGHVYFAACGAYVKIGYTSAPVANRLVSIRNGDRLIRPDDLDRRLPVALIHKIPGCVMRDERRIHGLFAAHHVVGEWYALTPAFLRHLAGLRYITYRETCLNFRRARADLKRRPSAVRVQKAAA